MRVVSVAGGSERVAHSLEYVTSLLDEPGVKQIHLDRPWARIDRVGRKTERSFQDTPAPLVESWRMSRLLQLRTRPGDVVLISDHAGQGGVFALAQGAARPESRRVVWTVAADSAYLQMRLISGAHHGLPMPLDSQIDWEITQYRWSDRVLAPSPRAMGELAKIGVEAELIGATSEDPPAREIDLTRIWVPGPVSRRNQTGDVLRAVSSLPHATVILGTDDESDVVWSGSSWDALRHVRAVLGSRVQRVKVPPEDPGVIVLGDPYSPPDGEVAALRARGVPVVVPEGGVASLRWPDATTWSGSDGLVDALTGGAQVGSPSARFAAVSATPSPSLPSEVRAVSVGIPIFRDVRYLRESVESVLSQDLQPKELLLIDDGSGSEEVDRTLAELVEIDPNIRVLATEHRGVCVARNIALEQMEGDSFVFVDSDDLLLPTFLSSCAATLGTSPDIWAVATWTEFFGAYEAVEAKPPFDHRVGMRENPIISTCALVDMRAREAGVRFAPDLAFLFCEDWHFWSQIAAAGGRFGLVPEALARHRVHTSSGGFLRTEVARAAGRSRAIEPLLR